MVARINENSSYSILREEKEVVRLGEKVFDTGALRHDAIERAVSTCMRFHDIAKGFNSKMIDTVATSATREASNQEEFINIVHNKVGLQVRVISGHEEARLIYQGVSSGVELSGVPVVFVDIGGGSTEVIVGGIEGYYYLDSLELGAIRIASDFNLLDYKGVVSEEKYGEIKQHIRNKELLTFGEIREYGIKTAYGSSGTIKNLAEMINEEPLIENRILSFTLDELKKLTKKLHKQTLKQRLKTPHINQTRGDIIVTGAAIIETLMEETGVEIVVATTRGLNYGLLDEYINDLLGHIRHRGNAKDQSTQVLGRNFGIDEPHAKKVTSLAFGLFDSGYETGLHNLGHRHRELLKYSSYLHDVGNFISYNDHHLHSAYIIRNANILGFDETEIDTIANIALYHREATPKRRHKRLNHLKRSEYQNIKILSMLLRIAENLDRSHSGAVKKAEFKDMNEKTVVLEISSSRNCDVEIWGVESVKKIFKKTFNKRMEIQVRELGCAVD